MEFSLKHVAIAVATAAAFSTASVTQAGVEGERKFNDVQVLGYLGKTSKSAMARSVYDRMTTKTTAPYSMNNGFRVLMFWHEVLLDSIAIDHTPDPDSGEVPFIQGGPGRTSRALGMTQIAVYDAVNAYFHSYTSYNDIGKGKGSLDVAIAAAAHGVLSVLYPNQKDRLDSLLESTIDLVHGRRGQIRKGLETGKKAAAAILASRSDDNSFDAEPSFGEGGSVADGSTTFYGTGVNGGSTFAPQWTPDPNTPEFSGDFNLSLGAYWGGVTPFFLESGDQFRIPAPPPIGSEEYISAYKEVAGLGGSPENENTFSFSTPETRFVGNFWGYDAAPLLGTPPRLYNQIARRVIKQNFDELDDQSINEAARLLAVLNAAIADAGIASWDSKWFYNYWRPVTGIRTEDGIAETEVDPTWDPVGVSIVNVELPEDQAFIRPSPPFPAYPSGHATFGAATFDVLRRTFGNDTPFSFVSDEYNGEGVDPFDPTVTRPLVPVFFATLDEAQESNGRSRIYNGVHWSYDNIQGQALGENLVNYLFSDNVSAFKPVE